MALLTQPYKGARDFYPEDKRLQNFIFSKLRETVERFGYEEYDAPILEPLELYLAKSSQEIVNEQTYTLTDRGGRQLALRPEMTPSVSRLVAARRQELAYPLRLYSIPNLWRYERPQRGRLREHWQLNVDLFGVAGIEAEHEIILLADSLLQAFQAKRDTYTIKLNSRKLIDFVLKEHVGLDETQAAMIRGLIDRKNKIDSAEFTAQKDAILSPTQRDSGSGDKLDRFLAGTDLAELPLELKMLPSVIQLEDLIASLRKAFITNVVFDPTLMRGFDYYTDVVFEVFDNHPDNNRSMFGGGRYDGLVGLFGVDPVPTIGFGMGDVTLKNFLEIHKLLPNLRPKTDLYAVLIGDVYDRAQRVLAELREMGLNVAVDSTGRKLDKQIKAAEKMGLTYVIFIGDKELEGDRFNLKNLKTGKDESHGLQRIVSIVKDYRRS